jgi:hypothetical protein
MKFAETQTSQEIGDVGHPLVRGSDRAKGTQFGWPACSRLAKDYGVQRAGRTFFARNPPRV